MLMPILAVLAGLILLVWSADRFVAGASTTAGHFSVPPLLVGMVIVGFGTSAPEMVVSTLAASQGNPGLALGNAWGSNIVNIALILGVTALVAPILVQSMILRKELPILTAVTLLAGYLVWDGGLSRTDAWVLLGVFAVLVGWSIFEGMRGGSDALAAETAAELQAHAMPLSRSLMWVGVGLVVLVGSSQLLVWGAAISTALPALAGRAPSMRQPLRRRKATEKPRSSVLTTGVVKMVRCMLGVSPSAGGASVWAMALARPQLAGGGGAGTGTTASGTADILVCSVTWRVETSGVLPSLPSQVTVTVTVL